MSATSKIEWTSNDDGTPGKTWNPVRGCSIVSPGCVNCYAMKQAHRFSGGPKVDGGQVVIREAGPYHGLTKQTKAGPQWTGKVVTVEDALLEPLSWRKPQRVFVNSMSDLFHEDVPDAFIDQVFAVMALTPRHTFQVLTKRPERMRAYCSTLGRHHESDRVSLAAKAMQPDGPGFFWTMRPGGWCLDNVWLGVSVENQKFADERIPPLLQTPAAVRFISAEPLLGPVDLEMFIHCQKCRGRGWYSRRPFQVPFPDMTPCEVCLDRARRCGSEIKEGQFAKLVSALDWVIVGGESGPGARPFDLAWARAFVQQCKAAGVRCFVKQLGARPCVEEGSAAARLRMAQGVRVDDCGGVHLQDRKGGNPDEWPDDLRVREFPEVRA